MGTVNDPAHEWTDERLRDLERAMRDEYSQAAEEMRDRLDRALRAYSSEKAQREKAMDNTEEDMKAHKEWLRMQAIQQTRMGSMVDQLADAAVNANARAMDMVRDAVPTIYSENANRAAFDVDKAVGYDTKFTLVDESAVRALIGSGVTDSPILREVRVPKVSRPKDYQWNRQEFTSAVTQGILQGESIPDIVKRTRSIFGMNRAAAFRAARTATTSAECAGRVSSYRRAERLGIDLMQEWMATVDPRTRPSHVALDGERVAVGEEFSNGLRFPGDPQGPGREVYNCRCTLVAAVDGIDQSAAARFSRLPEGMTYEGWRERARERLKARGATPDAGADHRVAEGDDILGTWRRRPDEFDFEIEDVLDAQGFDGKPRVVDADEFDQAVRQANGGDGLIMQRTYSAPDQATLDAYRDQLYSGKWYVDCSTGGAQYGQGMYCAADYTGKLSDGIKEEMQHYISLNESRGAEHAYVETMTLDPSAKIIRHADIDAEFARAEADSFLGVVKKANPRLTDREAAAVVRECGGTRSGSTFKLAKSWEREDPDGYDAFIEAQGKAWDEYKDAIEEVRLATASLDDGSKAAAMGYDAINAEGHGASGSYTVVLNRTKLIIRRPK